MTVCAADFERGAQGAPVLAIDAGSTTAWNSVNTNAGPVTYDNTHSYGRMAAKFVVSGAGATDLGWNTAFGTQTDHYGRLYLYLTSFPSAAIRLVVMTPGSGFAPWIAIDNAGRITTSDSGASSHGPMANSITLNQWVRIEWHIVHSATGSMEVKLFNHPESTTPTETLTSTSIDVDTNATGISVGWGSGSSGTETFWVDNIVAGASCYPGPATGYASLVLAENPLVYWKVDEASGDFVDSTGHTANATVYGDPYDYQQPPGVTIGYSIYNDTDSRAAVTVADFTDPDIWTVEAWIKTPGLSGSGSLLAFVEMSLGKPAMRIPSDAATNGGKIELVKSFVVLDGASTITVNDNQWHHIVARRTGGASRIWIDGVDRTGSMNNPSYVNNTGAPAGFGAHWSNASPYYPTAPFSNSFFVGNLDEIAIYDKALPDSTIIAHYRAGLGLLDGALTPVHGGGMGKW